MKDKNYIEYSYKRRSDVITDNVLSTLNDVYEISYPKPEKSFSEMCNDIKAEAEKAGRGNDINFRIEYCDGKYQWPIDFFYIPDNVLKRVWDNRKEIYGVKQHWKDNMQMLIDIMFINGGGLKEVYGPTSWSNGDAVRHCEKVPLLKDIIGKENADKVKDVLTSYMNTYSFGRSEEMAFSWGFMSTPTSNRETATKAWKEAFGVDIKIPDDSFWIDEFEKEDIVEQEFYSNE